MVMNQILVSVIIPVYNVEKYLSQCIESIICQNFSSLEVILINDGSTDNSLDICHYYASLDQRVKLIDKKNEGVGPARNDGLKIARGKYIYFLDSDDFVEPYFFDSLTPYLDGRFDIIQFGFNRVNESGILLNSAIPNNSTIIDLPNQRDKLVDIFNTGVGLTLWEKLIKRSLIEEHDIIFDNKKRGEDYTFIFKVFDTSGSVISIKKALINYRQLFGVSSKFDENLVENHIVNFMLMCELIKNNNETIKTIYLNRLFFWWFLIVIPLTISGYSKLTLIEKLEILNSMYENSYLQNFSRSIQLKKSGLSIWYLNQIFLLRCSRLHLVIGNILRIMRKLKYR